MLARKNLATNAGASPDPLLFSELRWVFASVRRVLVGFRWFLMDAPQKSARLPLVHALRRQPRHGPMVLRKAEGSFLVLGSPYTGHFQGFLVVSRQSNLILFFLACCTLVGSVCRDALHPVWACSGPLLRHTHKRESRFPPDHMQTGQKKNKPTLHDQHAKGNQHQRETDSTPTKTHQALHKPDLLEELFHLLLDGIPVRRNGALGFSHVEVRHLVQQQPNSREEKLFHCFGLRVFI